MRLIVRRRWWRRRQVDETGTQYASVLPIEKVLDPWGDVIMAYEMNGAPLPRDHGFPLRLIAPGTAGCRNAKWVCAIAVTAQPSELDSGSTLDRHFSPSVSFEDHRRHCAECGEDEDRPCATPAAARHDGRLATEFRAGPVIQSMPVTSMVTSPAAGATVEAAPGNAAVAVRGLAWGGAGRGVVRVEVSTDGGETFRAADIVPPPEPPTANGHPAPPAEMGCGRHWTWRQFEDLAPLGAADRARLAAGRSAAVRVCSKAVDGDFNSQPERMRSTWNALGICANHYSCVDVTVRPAPAPPAASDRRPPRAQ
jgi:sulfite oxidase